jgi:hypothetical protein
LNPRPPEPQSGALPTELRPPQCNIKVASPEGFEPPTHGLEGRCSVRLSYRDSLQKNGAGEGDRTLATSLEGWGSTIELHPPAKDIIQLFKAHFKRKWRLNNLFKLLPGLSGSNHFSWSAFSYVRQLGLVGISSTAALLKTASPFPKEPG